MKTCNVFALGMLRLDNYKAKIGIDSMVSKESMKKGIMPESQSRSH